MKTRRIEKKIWKSIHVQVCAQTCYSMHQLRLPFVFSHNCSVCPQAVKILLDFVGKRRVYQALLSAINLGNEEIAETIIEHPKYEDISNEIREHGRAYFYLNKFHDHENQFSEEITPLMLASQQSR